MIYKKTSMKTWEPNNKYLFLPPDNDKRVIANVLSQSKKGNRIEEKMS